MKVLFIQKYIFAYAGVMAISGFLKKHGHESRVLIDSLLKKKELISEIDKIKPDLIAFSLMSTDHNWFVDLIKFIKLSFPQIPIIVGGVHSIFYPDELIQIPEVDYVCTGEGEYTIFQLLEYLNNKIEINEVKGIAYKHNNENIKTPKNNLISLNDFTEDREIYYNTYKNLKNMPLKVFFSSRGCPFNCNFCANKYLQQIFKGLGTYVRKKSPTKFIEELEDIKNKYGFKFAFFADDLFISDKKWLKEFCSLYKEKINIPFICTCRVDKIDEEIISIIADAGCHSITFGVETGNPRIRNSILNKNITDEQLKKAANLFKKVGIKFQTSNMFCLPDETVEDAIRTIDLNIEIGASFTMSSIFMPFPKTELANICIEKGILKKDYSFENIPSSFITNSVLDIENKKTIQRIQKIAALAIQFPRFKNILIFLVKNIRIDAFHFFLYLIGTVFRFKEERKLNLIETLTYIWSYRKNI